MSNFVVLNGITTVNSDLVSSITLDQRTVTLRLCDGTLIPLAFAAVATAQTAYTNLVSLFGGLAGLPVLTGSFPSVGAAAGGLVFVLLGTNLSGGQFVAPFTGFGVSVKINGADASGNLLWDDRSISCVAPANPAGTYDIVYTRPDGKVATLVNGFQYV